MIQYEEKPTRNQFWTCFSTERQIDLNIDSSWFTFPGTILDAFSAVTLSAESKTFTIGTVVTFPSS